MLYVTTRSHRDAYTHHRALTADLCPDGGQFLPRQMPAFTAEDLKDMAERSFSENIAHVLNLLYRTELTGRDIELVIGKGSAGLLDLDSRTVVSRIWQAADGTFEDTVRRLFYLIVQEPEEKLGRWFPMSVRIAMLCAIFGELMAEGVEMPVDLAVPSMDFQLPMAAWYARSWGLPIGVIICACNENNAPWSLLHQGELRADDLIHTITPACDQAVPTGLERLIHATLGVDEVGRYLAALEAGRLYKLEPFQQEQLRSGVSVSVISRRRTEFMIPNIYRAGLWQPDLYAVMAWAALADHRARAGETGKALILAEENPLYCVDALARILTMPAEHLRRNLLKA